MTNSPGSLSVMAVLVTSVIVEEVVQITCRLVTVQQHVQEIADVTLGTATTEMEATNRLPPAGNIDKSSHQSMSAVPSSIELGERVHRIVDLAVLHVNITTQMAHRVATRSYRYHSPVRSEFL